VWVHFQFSGFPDEPVHVFFLGERSFVSLSTINQDHIVKLYVLSHIIKHEHNWIAFAIITRVAVQDYYEYRKLPNGIIGTTERYDRCLISPYGHKLSAYIVLLKSQKTPCKSNRNGVNKVYVNGILQYKQVSLF